MIGIFLKKQEQGKQNVWLILLKNIRQEGHYVVADFICPTPKARKLFNADYVVWIDTIEKGKFEDTNKMFVKPEKFDFRVTTQNAEVWAYQIADQLIPYEWDNKKPTVTNVGKMATFP